MDRYFTTNSVHHPNRTKAKVLEDDDLIEVGSVHKVQSPSSIFEQIKKHDKAKRDQKIKRRLNELEPIKKRKKGPVVIDLCTDDPGNINKSSSGVKLSSLMQNGRFSVGPTRVKSETFKVSFNVDSDRFKRTISGELKPVRKEKINKTQIKKHSGKSATALFFKEVSDRYAEMEKNPYRKRRKKAMEIPVLKKDMFLIQDVDDKRYMDEILSRKIETQFKPNKHIPIVKYEFTTDQHMMFYHDYKKGIHIKLERQYEPLYFPDADVHSRIMEALKQAPKDPRFQRFPKFAETFRRNNTLQWCDLFKPTNHKQILQRKNVRNEFYRWIVDTFKKLKDLDPKKRREIVKRHKQLMKEQAEMGDFIVDDAEERGEEGFGGAGFGAIGDSFAPSLIITGPVGCGKTSSVYTIVKNELHGNVFELNGSQPRARKDIEFHLRQIGTTQIVNTQMSGDRTVILFDDVDLIDDEERDKDFWIGVSNLLGYTYRPVIFTTSDLQLIPQKIIDQSTVLTFNENSSTILDKYMEVVSLAKGYDIDVKILDHIRRNSIRGCLMQLQMFCYRFEPLDVGLVDVSYAKRKKVEKPKIHQTKSQKLIKRELENDIKYSIGLTRYRLESPGRLYYSSPIITAQRYNTVEFYSQALFPNGTRSLKRRYDNADDYMDSNPGSTFERLDRGRYASEVIPFLKAMAKREEKRLQREKKGKHTRRRFVVDPREYFDDLHN